MLGPPVQVAPSNYLIHRRKCFLLPPVAVAARARNEGFLPANSVTNNVRRACLQPGRQPARCTAALRRCHEQFHFLSPLRGK